MMAYVTSETGVLGKGERLIHAEQWDGHVTLLWQGPIIYW